MTESAELPSPFPSRWLAGSLITLGLLLAAFGLFRFGQSQTMWSFVLVPHPIGLSHVRYAATALWPLPAGILLVLAGLAFRDKRSWRWVPVIAAALWLAAYPLIHPASQWDYYWLIPKSQ